MTYRDSSLEEILNKGDMRKVNSHLLDSAACINLPGTDPCEREAMHVTEKSFQNQVEKLLRMNGWKYYHTWNSMHSAGGFPDICAVRNQRVLFAELKAEGKDPGAKQVEWLDAVAKIPNIEVYLWYPSDYSKIDSILTTRQRPPKSYMWK